jgi:hypothetical protein
MSSRPPRPPNGVALQELYDRLKDIDSAIRSLEELKRLTVKASTFAVVKTLKREA